MVLILVPFGEVLAGRSRNEEEAIQSELSRLDDLDVHASNPFWADRARAPAFVVLHLVADLVRIALLEKRLIVAPFFLPLVAHYGCATKDKPLIRA